MKAFASILVALALAAPLAAAGDHGEGMPEQATFGLCTAWNANDTGREHSNGTVASTPPFQWLQDEAAENNQTVEEYCAERGAQPPTPPSPGQPDTPGTPDTPGAPTTPTPPTPPSTPGAPESPGAPSTPGAPETPTPPDHPGSGYVPEIPGAPSTPGDDHRPSALP